MSLPAYFAAQPSQGGNLDAFGQCAAADGKRILDTYIFLFRSCAYVKYLDQLLTPLPFCVRVTMPGAPIVLDDGGRIKYDKGRWVLPNQPFPHSKLICEWYHS
jgi:hypothetical protein